MKEQSILKTDSDTSRRHKIVYRLQKCLSCSCHGAFCVLSLFYQSLSIVFIFCVSVTVLSKRSLLSASLNSMESAKGETKRKSLKNESEPIEEENETSSPSIYAVVAAHSLSKDIKQKSLHLIKVKRRHGDWGQFDLTHAWSPEDLMSNMGSRHSSALARDSSLVDENLTMAQPFVMEPLRTFQVC